MTSSYWCVACPINEYVGSNNAKECEQATNTDFYIGCQHSSIRSTCRTKKKIFPSCSGWSCASSTYTRGDQCRSTHMAVCCNCGRGGNDDWRWRYLDEKTSMGDWQDPFVPIEECKCW
jgi:hypothetical protein